MVISVQTQNGNVDVEVRPHVFSPCTTAIGTEYALVLYEGRHPMMSDAPVRTHGTGLSTFLAHANALAAFSQAYNRITKQAGRRTQETRD